MEDTVRQQVEAAVVRIFDFLAEKGEIILW